MDPAPQDVQAAFCQVLVDELARAGVTEAVVAPGSRSTPLVLALDADPRVRLHVVLDERSAGFTALGLALGSGRPAVVSTTSGTAAVELHPAVVEAHHAGVPLIAVTSDRPAELHHVGAPQTVEQETLFVGATRWCFSLGAAELVGNVAWRSLGSRCVAEALGAPGRKPGPVHLNLAFREPLLGDSAAVEVPAGRSSGEPWHRVSAGSCAVPEGLVERLARFAGGRGLVLAGAGGGDPRRLVEAARRLGWPVLADPRSGCRQIAGAGVVCAADALLRVPGVASGWIPEVVVRVGAPWASRVVSEWLAGLPGGVLQMLADPGWGWADPERQIAEVALVDGAVLLEAVAEVTGGAAGESPWEAAWMAAERRAQGAMEELLGPGGELELSEPAVARALLASMPAGSAAVVSSSMPVRDAEWYGPPACAPTVLANRGANGIDGVISTAIGVALSRSGPVAALIGDLAFLYDAGALLGASKRDLSLTVVVLDNNGGGIFSFLPQAASLAPERFERYWGTPHGVDLVRLASAYGALALAIGARQELDELLARTSAAPPGVTAAVVRSDRRANVVAHQRLNAAVAAAVAPVAGALEA